MSTNSGYRIKALPLERYNYCADNNNYYLQDHRHLLPRKSSHHSLFETDSQIHNPSRQRNHAWKDDGQSLCDTGYQSSSPQCIASGKRVALKACGSSYRYNNVVVIIGIERNKHSVRGRCLLFRIPRLFMPVSVHLSRQCQVLQQFARAMTAGERDRLFWSHCFGRTKRVAVSCNSSLKELLVWACMATWDREMAIPCSPLEAILGIRCERPHALSCLATSSK